MSKKPERSHRVAEDSDREPREQRERREQRESGEPGGGTGRRDEVGPTGVYPMSGGIPEGKHPEIRTPAAWGQGERGPDGYNDSGGSELVMHNGELLGGLTAGPGGEPTIDIHGGDRQPTDAHGEQRPKHAKDRDLTSDEPDR